AVLAPARLAHLRAAGDLGGGAHAARAGDAARHGRGNERAEVQILGRPLRLAEAAEIHAVGHGLVLKVAFAALVADRAVERVVDEQELHHPFPRLLDHRRVGLDHRGLSVRPRPQVLDLHGAGGGGLRRPAHDLDEAHPAVAGNGEPFMVAEARNLHPGLFAGLDERQVRIDLDFYVVDDDLAEVGHQCFSVEIRGPGTVAGGQAMKARTMSGASDSAAERRKPPATGPPPMTIEATRRRVRIAPRTGAAQTKRIGPRNPAFWKTMT